MVISNENIKIKVLQREDATEFSVAVLESTDTVGKWMPWCHSGYQELDALEWIESCRTNYENNLAYDLGLFSSENHFIGSIAINQINSRYGIGNIGYWVRESCQNRGYATEAVTLIKQYDLDVLNLNRLEIVVLENNLPSRTAAEKSGAVFECIAQNRLVHNGVSMAAAVYSLVPASSSN